MQIEWNNLKNFLLFELEFQIPAMPVDEFNVVNVSRIILLQTLITHFTIQKTKHDRDYGYGINGLD